jgi:hypothetical protein
MTAPLTDLLTAALPGVATTVTAVADGVPLYEGHAYMLTSRVDGLEYLVIQSVPQPTDAQAKWCDSCKRYTRHDHNGRRLACAMCGRT